MKIIRNILFLSLLSLIGLLPSYGRTEELIPKEVIKKYIPFSVRNGNVLSYKNYNDETIVLKSGKFFQGQQLEVNEKAIALNQVIKCVAGDTNLDENEPASKKQIKEYCEFCAQGNNVWYGYIEQLHPYHQCTNNCEPNFERKEDPKAFVTNQTSSDLQQILGSFRHTEIQVQALYNAYKETKKEEIKALLGNSYIN